MSVTLDMLDRQPPASDGAVAEFVQPANPNGCRGRAISCLNKIKTVIPSRDSRKVIFRICIVALGLFNLCSSFEPSSLEADAKDNARLSQLQGYEAGTYLLCLPMSLSYIAAIASNNSTPNTNHPNDCFSSGGWRILSAATSTGGIVFGACAITIGLPIVGSSSIIYATSQLAYAILAP